MVKAGVTTSINTKHQCITAMKEYENKSLEVSLTVFENQFVEYQTSERSFIGTELAPVPSFVKWSVSFQLVI